MINFMSCFNDVTVKGSFPWSHKECIRELTISLKSSFFCNFCRFAFVCAVLSSPLDPRIQDLSKGTFIHWKRRAKLARAPNFSKAFQLLSVRDFQKFTVVTPGMGKGVNFEVGERAKFAIFALTYNVQFWSYEHVVNIILVPFNLKKHLGTLSERSEHQK